MNKAPLLLAAVTLFSFAGCAGYHTGVPKPKKMAGITKIAVPTFKNETLAPRLEVLVTDAVIKQLQMNGAYKIVSVGEAEAVLHGIISDVTSRQFRAARNNTLRTSQLEVGLVIKYSMVAASGDGLLDGEARDTSTLIVDPNLQVTKQQALVDAAQKLAVTVSTEVSEGW